MFRFGSSGLSFQCSDVFPSDLLGDIGICYSDWAVLYLVALQYPFEVVHRGVSELGIEGSCCLSAFDLSLAISFFVAGDCVDKNVPITIFQFVIVESAAVHLELHVGFIVGFSVHHKHLVLAIVGDSVLFGQVAEGEDIGYSFLAKPNLLGVSRHRCLLCNLHGPTIARERHGAT